MNLRERSRQEWNESSYPTDRDELKLGCLQRIADAVELMAVEHRKLMEERDAFKRYYENVCIHRDEIMRSNAALRGVITRMKRKLREA